MIISDCAESLVHIDGETVRKIYKPLAHRLDKIYNRKGERYILATYPSPFFIEYVGDTKGGIILKYGGIRLGGHDRFDPAVVRLFEVSRFIEWLKGLKQELLRLGIRHRDINPRNLLYNKNTKEFKLIDFTYATDQVEDDFDHGKSYAVNMKYGRDDQKAIDLLIEDVSRYG